MLSTLRVIVQSVYAKLGKAEKELKFLKRTLGMKAFHECVETLRRDGGMSKDTGELINKKSIILCCQPIFSYISSLIIVPNSPFSQSLSQYYYIVCANFFL